MTNKINPGELWGEHQDFCYNNNFQYCLFVISTQTDRDGFCPLVAFKRLPKRVWNEMNKK